MVCLLSLDALERKAAMEYNAGLTSKFIEVDIFRIIVPMDDTYSFDFGQNGYLNKLNQSNHSNQTELYEDEIAPLIDSEIC